MVIMEEAMEATVGATEDMEVAMEAMEVAMEAMEAATEVTVGAMEAATVEATVDGNTGTDWPTRRS